MDNKIMERLKSYNNRAVIEEFLDITNELITELNITNDDTRFCLNVRNENNRKRISLNLNGRLAGGLKNDGSMDYYILMLYSSYGSLLVAKGIKLMKMDKAYENSKTLANAETFLIDADSYNANKDDIKKNWIMCCADYLPSQSSSQYRKHHLPELYDLVVNNEFRKTQLDLILNNHKTQIYKMEFFSQEDLQYYSAVMLTDKFYRTENQDSVDKGLRIKTTIFDKTNYWAKLLAEKDTSFIHIEDNKWQLSGTIKGYSWVRINLVEQKNSKVFFTIGVSGENKNLLIKLDCQRGNADKLSDADINTFDRLKEHYKIEDLIIYDNQLNEFTWEKLVNMTHEFLIKHLEDYKMVINKLADVEDNHKNDNTVIKYPLNQIFYGSPGTGKTYHTMNYALSIVEGKSIMDLEKEKREDIKKRYD
jgi:hypothetical protein